MEIVLGPLTWLIVGAATAMYLRWFSSSIERDAAFEAWCKSAPIVMAFRCHDDGERLLRMALLERLGRRREVINVHGRFPWPFYRLKLDVLSREGRVEVRLDCARLVLGERSTAQLLTLLDGLDDEVFSRIDEEWVHGECFPGKRHSGSDRSKFGWVGTLTHDGLDVREMIGVPGWLADSREARDATRAA
jgi:hypothetical protein